ncbi:Fic/DOC family protein [Saccharothrix australiensis]|uniref:protein adenylyltransferase n=1 Tax=Saccharothrix australiensis TaxID=2072 RepID=A0A495WCP2_9PSEU|nr:Fic family protein [Saccharothrix australiensis]RKT57578.1 cell filamentation protein [Saccharothrix australiensis]
MTFEDPYADPVTGVLRNRFGLTDKSACDAAETRLSTLRVEQLAVQPLPGLYDLAHLQAFHRHIFGDFYEWAGDLRRVDIRRSAMFAAWRQIEPYGAWLFEELRKERFLRDVAREPFLDRFTHYFAEVNALHPFREGNGRTQRAFFRQLAREAGWRVAFHDLDPTAFNEACRVSMAASVDDLRALLAAVITPA